MSDLAKLVQKLRKQAAKLPSGPAIALGPPARVPCVCAGCVRARAAYEARKVGPNADHTQTESRALPGRFA